MGFSGKPLFVKISGNFSRLVSSKMMILRFLSGRHKKHYGLMHSTEPEIATKADLRVGQ